MFFIIIFIITIILWLNKNINKIGKKFIILYTLLLLIFIRFNDYSYNINFKWLNTNYFNIYTELISKNFFNLIVVLVILITFLILLYSTDYMSNDNKLINFLYYMFFFSFVMSLAILWNDNILLFFSWECIGITSFLLISFWSFRVEASKSGTKAILMNKFGDIYLFLFLLASWAYLYIFNIDLLNTLSFFFNNNKNISFDCKFLLVYWLVLAAITKSAQIILSSWLTDAMEGPTPVSALLHSATMVGIGYLLLVKFSDNICNWKYASYFIVFIGITTILFASIAAYTNNDIKAILANSTSAQLGYMFLALGSYQIEASIMHFTTHAFYKALLFLTAGFIIHIKDFQDHRIFDIQKSKYPLQVIFIFIGLISLIGIPSTLGSFSKEFIIMQNIYTYSNFNIIVTLGALLGLFLTLFYNINLFYRIFKRQLNINSKKFMKGKNHKGNINIILSLYILSIILIIGLYLYNSIKNWYFNDLDMLWIRPNIIFINYNMDYIGINLKLIPIFIILFILFIFNFLYYKYNINNKMSFLINDSWNKFFDMSINDNIDVMNDLYYKYIFNLSYIFYNIFSLDIVFITKNNINMLYRNYILNNLSFFIIFILLLFIFIIFI